MFLVKAGSWHLGLHLGTIRFLISTFKTPTNNRVTIYQCAKMCSYSLVSKVRYQVAFGCGVWGQFLIFLRHGLTLVSCLGIGFSIIFIFIIKSWLFDHSILIVQLFIQLDGFQLLLIFNVYPFELGDFDFLQYHASRKIAFTWNT